jgi:multidrug efflux pump subunit AcrA (membrane-fusion protein)
MAVVLLASLSLGAVAAWRQSQPAGARPPVSSGATELTARGEVAPARHARLGTLTGGVIVNLSVDVGDRVRENEEVARVRGPDGAMEVVTAPWAGTITAIPANQGDTVLPGAVIASLGDLSKLRVETTDVDEYLIGRLHSGDVVRLVVDALDGRELQGVVRSVSLVPQPSETGSGEHFPIVVDLVSQPADLLPGMTVRIWVPEPSGS